MMLSSIDTSVQAVLEFEGTSRIAMANISFAAVEKLAISLLSKGSAAAIQLWDNLITTRVALLSAVANGLSRSGMVVRSAGDISYWSRMTFASGMAALGPGGNSTYGMMGGDGQMAFDFAASRCMRASYVMYGRAAVLEQYAGFLGLVVAQGTLPQLSAYAGGQPLPRLAAAAAIDINQTGPTEAPPTATWDGENRYIDNWAFTGGLDGAAIVEVPGAECSFDTQLCGLRQRIKGPAGRCGGFLVDAAVAARSPAGVEWFGSGYAVPFGEWMAGQIVVTAPARSDVAAATGFPHAGYVVSNFVAESLTEYLATAADGTDVVYFAVTATATQFPLATPAGAELYFNGSLVKVYPINGSVLLAASHGSIPKLVLYIKPGVPGKIVFLEPRESQVGAIRDVGAALPTFAAYEALAAGGVAVPLATAGGDYYVRVQKLPGTTWLLVAAIAKAVMLRDFATAVAQLDVERAAVSAAISAARARVKRSGAVELATGGVLAFFVAAIVGSACVAAALLAVRRLRADLARLGAGMERTS